MQVVIFGLGEEQFAVETSRVQNITDMMEVTNVPKAPKYIKGLINLRGNINSLLDIHLLLNIKKVEGVETQNIIILKTQNELVGVAVDKVVEVLEFDETAISKLETESKNRCVKGIINLQDRIITLIDIDKLLVE